MNNEFKKRMARILVLVCLMVGCFTVFAFAANDAFDAGEEFVGDASSWIIKLSSAAAVIGVGTGAALRKFSFGDMEKIKMGGKLMWGAIFAWAVLNGLPLIFRTIQHYIS